MDRFDVIHNAEPDTENISVIQVKHRHISVCRQTVTLILFNVNKNKWILIIYAVLLIFIKNRLAYKIEPVFTIEKENILNLGSFDGFID